MTQSIQKTDRRVAKTRLALREAMMFLLAEQGWDDMSIQSICDRANVGRSTFYLHYPSKNDLLLVSLGELRDGLCVSAADSKGEIGEDILKGLLEHMVEQLPVFRAVIGRRSALFVASSFRNMIVELIELELRRHQHPAGQIPWLIRFLAGGIHESMTWWVDAAQPCSIRDLEQQLCGVFTVVLVQYGDNS